MNTCKILNKPEKDTLSGKKTSDITVFLPILFSLAFFVMLLCLPSVTRAAVSDSLALCATKLIPSLFPFMVMGELLFALGADKLFCGKLSRPFEKLFGISGNGIPAFLFGAVCGLPLGGKYALTLYENGSISKSDCEKLMGISNNAGMGFVVAGVGGAIWGSIKFGFVLYACQIFSTIVSGIILFRDKKDRNSYPITCNSEKKSFASAFAESVSSGSVNLIKVCGFVIFFGTLSAFISEISGLLALPELFPATLSAFCEISNACQLLHDFAVSSSGIWSESAKILTFFAIGFAGMSAHMQLTAFASTAKDRPSFKIYYLTKLLSGVICGFSGAVLLHFLSV